MAFNECKFSTKSFKRNLNAFHNNSSLFIQPIDQQYDGDSNFTLRDYEEKSHNCDTLSLTTASLDDDKDDIQYGNKVWSTEEDRSLDPMSGLANDRAVSILKIQSLLSESISKEFKEKALTLRGHSKKLKISSMLKTPSSYFVYQCHKFKVLKQLEFLLRFEKMKMRKLKQKHGHTLLNNRILMQNCIPDISLAYLHPCLPRIAY